jgi:hypothetical protein
VDYLHFRVDHFRQTDVIHQVEYFIHLGIHQALVVAYQGKPHFRPLMGILESHFGDGNVESVSDPGDDRFKYFSFAFQTAAIMQPESDTANADDHEPKIFFWVGVPPGSVSDGRLPSAPYSGLPESPRDL